MSWSRLSNHKAAGGMGFRDLRDFNLAMLGKQGWRFLSNPDSMVSKLFKARFYPKGNFLTAATSNNPSYVWRSICEAKPLLISGVRWLVGSGESISIKNQPWLDDAANPYIISDSPTFENNTVASLMGNNSRE
ncbi:putative mitochondrial protein AtMg00310 [Apium graveolens]|uniref:putative mitochondrial protein AtMg00310 n=1 Tax=Apium graveolens TaxID=4045 RepID=UPI003D7B4C8C